LYLQKKDCTELHDFTSEQKCIAALRCLVYGAPSYAQDDYIGMAESAAFETVYRLYRMIVAVLMPHYLKAFNEEDTARILAQSAAR
jgi:hypothetical protein